MAAKYIRYTVGELTWHEELVTDNPETVKAVIEGMPSNSFLLHPVVSGKGFLFPTTIIFIGKGKMVVRNVGCAYLYAPGQSLVRTHGETSETAKVNVFANVIPEDLKTFQAVGQMVYETALGGGIFKEMNITITLLDEQLNIVPRADPASGPEPEVDGSWLKATTYFKWHAHRILQNTPDVIIKMFAGINDHGMGTGERILPVWLHAWAYLMMMGPNILFRFLLDTEAPGATAKFLGPQIIRHLEEPFSQAAFLCDLGLPIFKQWNETFKTAMDSIDVTDNEAGMKQIRELAGAYMTAINAMHRRIQQRLFHHLANAFPRRTPEEYCDVVRILLDEVISGERPLPENFPLSTILELVTQLATTGLKKQ